MLQEIKNFILEGTDFKTAFVLGSAAIILLSQRIFPLCDSLCSHIIYFFVLPLFIIIFVFRDFPKEFGISLGEKGKVIRYTIATCLLFFPAIFIASLLPEFQDYYSLQRAQLFSSTLFFLLSWTIKLFCWEFFFRAFFTFGLYRKLGYYAVYIQAIPFAFAHLGKPILEVYSSFFAAIIMGYAVLKSKSFFPAFLIHLFVYFSLVLLI